MSDATRNRSVASKWEISFAWISHHYILMLSLIAFLIYLFTYLEGSFGNPIRSDGAGYYAYLPSYLIYGDPSFERDADERYGGEFPGWTYVRRYVETGRYLNTYNIGVSVLLAPFFMVAHLFTWVMRSPPGGPPLAFDHAADGYTLFYQHAAGLAGVFYFLAMVALLKKLLDRQFGKGASLFSVSAVVFGTNMLNYGTGETVNAHPSTVFLLVCLLWATPRWYQSPRSWSRSVLLGGLLGLLYLTRPLNVLFWIIVPLYGLQRKNDFLERLAWVMREYRAVLLTGSCMALVLVPQLLVWRYATGALYVNSYGSSYGWVAPQLATMFFSVYKGMFFWFPITLLAFAGFYSLYFRARQWFWPSCLGCIIFLGTVSSYFLWTGAGGFGNRYIVDITPLMAFPLAALWHHVRHPVARFALLCLAGTCILWSLFLMKLYYTREISFYGLDAQAVFDIFWWRWKALQSGLFPG